MKRLIREKLFSTPKPWQVAALALIVLTFGLLVIPAPPIERPNTGGGLSSNTIYGMIQDFGPTNSGQTAVQVSAAIVGGAILQTNGGGIGTTLGNLTETNGAYKTFWLANGAQLTTNQIPPFDWEYKDTNGVRTSGTNGVTLGITTNNGDFNIYHTFTDASNYRMGGLHFNGNDLYLASVGLGTGASTGDLYVEASGTHSIRFRVHGTNVWNIDDSAMVPMVDARFNFGRNTARILTNYSQYFVGDGSGLTGVSGSVPSGLVTNGANADINVINGGDRIILRADDLSLMGQYVRVGQAVLTNNTDSGQVRLSSTTNAAGAVLEIEGAVSGGGSPVTIRGAGGVIFEGTASFSQLTATTATFTNVLIPTNAFVGTVVDFSKGEGRTNLGGNLTITAVANVTAGAMNSCIITMAANGADRTIAFPASFHVGRGATLVVTNGTEAEFLFRLQPGVRTNVYQLDSL